MGTCNQLWPWFAIQVRTCSEATAAKLLQSKGYECYLPLTKCKRHWSDRIKVLEMPLFPGYLFCRCDIQNRLPILKTPGVLQMVGAGKVPIPVDEPEISALQQMGRSGLQAQPWPYLKAGDIARIQYGPLRGLTGIVVGVKSDLKFVLSVTLLQRSVAVEVDRDWLEESHTLHAAHPAGRGISPSWNQRVVA
jgi:transcription antitermination factor NusG